MADFDFVIIQDCVAFGATNPGGVLSNKKATIVATFVIMGIVSPAAPRSLGGAFK